MSFIQKIMEYAKGFFQKLLVNENRNEDSSALNINVK